MENIVDDAPLEATLAMLVPLFAILVAVAVGVMHGPRNAPCVELENSARKESPARIALQDRLEEDRVNVTYSYLQSQSLRSLLRSAFAISHARGDLNGMDIQTQTAMSSNNSTLNIEEFRMRE
eukprot:gb/GECG01010091.1/.p1 GENE.gb/GECG01010091.1/~~gb/GECG01010091.1/.p1  ORF type:complete len:123 (+),score=15.78 gb/GECG01010091.1/:1-369(+)